MNFKLSMNTTNKILRHFAPQCLALLVLCLPLASSHAEQQLTHGAMVAEVTSSSAIIWARGGGPSIMHVTIEPDASLTTYQQVLVAQNDFTGHVRVNNLAPDTTYRYQVRLSANLTNVSTAQIRQAATQLGDVHISEAAKHQTTGTFRTAPSHQANSSVSFTWTGDFGGQNVCRDQSDSYPIFNAIAQEGSDFFIGLGDMIYADGVCSSIGRYGNKQIPGDFVESADLKNFWAHWRYNRADLGFQKVLSSTSYYGVWDDHEVVNDFGPLTDERATPPYKAGQRLLPIGLKAFLDYTPMTDRLSEPNKLYRNIRWGQHAELFFLDTRQYRDANLQSDQEEKPKTMLGDEQLQWLLKNLAVSDATWKIIVSSVPVSIPTGFPTNLGRDGWANDDDNRELTTEGIPQASTGFEQELKQILSVLERHEANTVFLTTDVHFAEVFRYQPNLGNPNYHVHEFVVGPGNAGIFPNRRFDKTFGSESLFFFGPERTEDVTSWELAKSWFNYGSVEISDRGIMRIRVKDVKGASLYELRLQPTQKDATQ